MDYLIPYLTGAFGTFLGLYLGDGIRLANAAIVAIVWPVPATSLLVHFVGESLNAVVDFSLNLNRGPR